MFAHSSNLCVLQDGGINAGKSSSAARSIRFPERVLAGRAVFQIVVVHEIRRAVRLISGHGSDLFLSNDFARRDFLRESVSMIWNQAVESLAVKFSLLHPNLFLAFGSELKINALVQSVAAV